MFETVFSSVTDAQFTVGGSIVSILSALVLGGCVSATNAKSAKNGVCSKNFLLTLVILPAVIAVIIMLVGSNLASAFSLAGVFALVRFRSEPGDPKDIAYVCLVMAIGLSVGMGYIGYAVLITAILCGVLLALSHILFQSKQGTRYLRVTIPEDLNFSGAFDDVMGRYARRHTLTKVRTTDLGSLFRLDYTVELKDVGQEKEFIDQLRCRNGNLDITMLLYESEN